MTVKGVVFANPEYTTPSIGGVIRWKKLYGHPLLTESELTTAFFEAPGRLRRPAFA